MSLPHQVLGPALKSSRAFVTSAGAYLPSASSLKAYLPSASPLKDYLLSASSLKIIGAFAGGIACTGVVMAAWSGALDSFLSHTKSPEPTQFAAIAPSGGAAPTGSSAAAPPPADTPQREITGSGESKDITDTPVNLADGEHRDGCDNQVWPYIDQRCLTKAGSDSAARSRTVRIVSTDRTVTSDRTPVYQNRSAPTQQPSSSENVAAPEAATALAASLPLPTPDPRKAGDDAAASPQGPQASSEPQPSRSTTASNEPLDAERTSAPEARSGRRHAESATSKRRPPSGEDRSARAGGDAANPFADRDTPRRYDTVLRRYDGRRAMVERVYRLSDGRHVVVRQPYRAARQRDARRMAPTVYRRPMFRYQSLAGPGDY